MRRHRVAAGLTALVAGAVPFVASMPAAHAGIESPAADQVSQGPAVIRGSQPLGKTVDRVTLTITPAGGGTAASVPGCSGSTCGGTAGTFSAVFDPPANGTYTAVAVAEHDSRNALDRAESSRSAPVTFGVEQPPAAPRRLVAEANGAQRTVTLSWSPNSEPDLTGYQVSRRVDGGAPQAVGNVGPSTTTFTDQAGDGGDLRYTVVAIRRGATASTWVASPESNSAGVTVARVAPPTTVGGTSGGGAGAGSGGESGAPTGSGGGAADGGASSGGLRPTAASAPVRITPGAQIDLSGYKPNANPLTIGPAPAPDPGYLDTLPYAKAGDAGAADDGAEQAAVQDEAALPVGSLTTTTTETNRRALLSFLAGAMLLFMLSMHLRWLLRRTAVAG